MHEAKGWGLLRVPTPTPLALGARRRRVGDDSRSISMERRFPRRHRQPPHLKTAHSSTVGRRRYCAPLPALPTLLSADRIYVSPGAMDWGEIGFFLRGFSSTSRANTLLLLVFLLCLPRQLTPVTPHRPRPDTFLDRYPHHADAARSHAILCIPYHPACKKKISSSPCFFPTPKRAHCRSMLEPSLPRPILRNVRWSPTLVPNVC